MICVLAECWADALDVGPTLSQHRGIFLFPSGKWHVSLATEFPASLPHFSSMSPITLPSLTLPTGAGAGRPGTNPGPLFIRQAGRPVAWRGRMRYRVVPQNSRERFTPGNRHAAIQAVYTMKALSPAMVIRNYAGVAMNTTDCHVGAT